jgi:hypothetical protein
MHAGDRQYSNIPSQMTFYQDLISQSGEGLSYMRRVVPKDRKKMKRRRLKIKEPD